MPQTPRCLVAEDFRIWEEDPEAAAEYAEWKDDIR
jgi:hypothetical protein